MDVQLLMQLCEALEYNFFKDLAGLCDNTLAKGVSEQDKITYISTTEKLTEELIECKEKYTMLKQIYISKNGPII